MSTLPSLNSTLSSNSPARSLHLHEHLGCFVSPISRQPTTGSPLLPRLDSIAVPHSAASPTSTLSSTTSSHCQRYCSPTGFNRPISIPTPIRTVRRMFHHASPADRRVFYEAFLDRPVRSRSVGYS